MLHCGNKDLGNSGSVSLDRGAVCIVTSRRLKISIMEIPTFLENGNIPQQRKFTCCQVAFYTLIFVLIIISALVPVVFCLLRHKQAPELCWAHGSLKNSTRKLDGLVSWEWNLEHCNGFVQKDRDEYLVIEQRGNYFIYAQVFRKKDIEQPFTLTLYKEPKIVLNKAVGAKEGDGKGTVHFGRPFFLQKGDKLYCEAHLPLDSVLAGDQSYWGLYKM